MGDKALFLLAEGMKNLWRHKLTAFAAVFSVFLSLMLVGTLIIAGQNTQKVIQYFRGKYKIEVFFKEGTTEERSQILVKEISAIPGVRSTTLITKEDAVRIFESQFGENILDLVGYNPLPISCVVNVIRNRAERLNVDPIIDKIWAFSEVEEVNYQGALIYRIEGLYQKFLKLTMILTIVILIISVIIISNTLRLTIYAKRDLIRALQLIGATRTFIKAPFIIEGIIQGVLGALMAAGVLIGGLTIGSRIIASQFSFKVQYEPFLLTMILVGISVVISYLGSSRAASKLLK